MPVRQRPEDRQGTGARDSRKSTARIALAVIVLAGAALRVYHINHQSIWYDESISLTVARAPVERMGDFFKGSGGEPPLEYNPPVYFYLLHAWFRVFGFGDLQARLFSAAAGSLSLVLIYFLAKQVYDRRTALMAAGLLAVSQLGVMYSQEARHYALFLLLFLATVYLFKTATGKRSLGAWCGATACAILMTGTHYYGAFALLGLFGYAVFYRKSNALPLSWVAGAAAAGVVALAPWCISHLSAQLQEASGHPNAEFFAVGPLTLFHTLNRFHNGRIAGILQAPPMWAFFAGALLFAGPILLMLVRWLKLRWNPEAAAEREATALMSILWMGPIAIVLLLGLRGVQFDVRYVAFCITPYYILAAAGIARLPRRWLRATVFGLILCAGIYGLRANYFIPYKENYRDAIAYISRQAVEGDCYAFVPFEKPPLEWAIYNSRVPQTVIGPKAQLSGNGCGRIWVIRYQRLSSVAPRRWRPYLETLAATRRKVDVREFHWVNVELYV